MASFRRRQWCRYWSLHNGPPVERSWIVWHMSIGLGAGLFSIDSYGPPTVLVVLFFWSALTITFGLWMSSPKAVSRGLILLAIASGLRAVALWDLPQRGAGSNWIASFTWATIAVGDLMESTSVRCRGIQARGFSHDGQVRRRDGGVPQ